MSSSKQIIVSILAVLLLFVGGSFGYMLIERWDFLDALYMTVITLATVGYGEVHSISQGGRIYTIFLILAGVGFIGYVVGTVTQYMVEGRIRTILGRQKLNRKIDRLKNHYIVCGYGRIGRVLCKNLQTRPVDLVVIERDPACIPTMDADGILYVCDDAVEETTLVQARIKSAKGLIAALATDIDNVFLILTARQLNPDLFIVARAGAQGSESKLQAAGADKVESPYEIGAAAMAQRILRPTVTSFLELAVGYQNRDIQMEEIPVGPKSSLADIMLKDTGIRQDFNLIIIAIKKVDGTMQFNPSFETMIHPGDTVIAVGGAGNLNKLEKKLNP